MKRNLIFWGTTITVGALLVLLNVYVYQPEKKTITFFKVENHKIVPPTTIVHKHNTQKQKPKSIEHKETEKPKSTENKETRKKTENIKPDPQPRKANNTPQKTEVTPKLNNNTLVNTVLTYKQTDKNNIKPKNTAVESKQVEKQPDEVKNFPFIQPLYHIKKTKTDSNPETKKLEAIYHEEKFFDYHHALKSYFERNVPHSEYLWIIDDKDYVHTTSQNSKIKLHNTVFVDKYGHKIQGEAVLEFKELVNGKDMFKANVNTSIDKKLKQAHQVWYIGAKQKNKTVFMGQNTLISIEVQSLENLVFYMGKRNYNGEIEWKPVPKNQVQKIPVSIIKKRGILYEYYCNLSELGWVAAFYEENKDSKEKENKEIKPLSVSIKASNEISSNEISVYYIDDKANYPLQNLTQTTPLTSYRNTLARKIKKYTQGNLFEGNIPVQNRNKGKIIALAYDKGNYYFAQTNINVHKEQIELNLLPVKETEINQYICND